jgi:CRP-like cAMP-binding protein
MNETAPSFMKINNKKQVDEYETAFRAIRTFRSFETYLRDDVGEGDGTQDESGTLAFPFDEVLRSKTGEPRDWYDISPGESMIRKGPTNEKSGVLFIVRGTAVVWRNTPSGNKIPLSRRGVGVPVGELSAVGGGVETAGSEAESPVVAFEVPHSDFKRLFENNIAFRKYITKALVEKIRQSHWRLVGLVQRSPQALIATDILTLIECHQGIDFQASIYQEERGFPTGSSGLKDDSGELRLEAPMPTQKRWSEFLRIDQSAISRTIKMFKEGGIIEVRPSEGVNMMVVNDLRSLQNQQDL